MASSPDTMSRTRTVSRRTLAKGVAWSVPAVVFASAAPAFAASPTSCRSVNMDWGNARTPKLPNGTVYTVVGTQTVYAKVTYTETAPMRGSTGSYHLGIGRTAWGQVGTDFWGNPTISSYTINSTAGRNDLILNQQAGTGATTVTISFWADAAATIPVYVNDLQVPLDDFSAQRTYVLLKVRPDLSYEEAWSVSGTTRTGSITPSITGISNVYNDASTIANIKGSGTLADPWHFPVETMTSSSRNQVGGNVLTKFALPVSSVTVTYGSNASSYAKTNSLSGPQGAGLGRLTMCV